MPEINLISTREACRLLGDIDKATLLSWVHQGKITPVHRGATKNSGYLFDRDYVVVFAEQLRQLAARPPVDALPGLEIGR